MQLPRRGGDPHPATTRRTMDLLTVPDIARTYFDSLLVRLPAIEQDKG